MCLQTPSFLQCTSLVFLRCAFLHVTTTFTEKDKYNASFKTCVWKNRVIQMGIYSFVLDDDNEILVMLSKCI